VEEGCYSCWSDGGRASGVVAASEPVAKHGGCGFGYAGPFGSTQPNPEILVGLFVSSLMRTQPAYPLLWTRIECIFRNDGLALPLLDFDDGNAAAFTFASGNCLHVLPATAGGFRFGGAGFLI
jgi:hypothetical protein